MVSRDNTRDNFLICCVIGTAALIISIPVAMSLSMLLGMVVALFGLGVIALAPICGS